MRLGTRVGIEVLALPELHGVDVNTRHHGLGMFPRLLHQMHMTGVEIAHGGNEGDALARLAQARDLLPQCGDGFDRDHAE